MHFTFEIVIRVLLLAQLTLAALHTHYFAFILLKKCTFRCLQIICAVYSFRRRRVHIRHLMQATHG